MALPPWLPEKQFLISGIAHTSSYAKHVGAVPEIKTGFLAATAAVPF
jgi:hypothetical protein